MYSLVANGRLHYICVLCDIFPGVVFFLITSKMVKIKQNGRRRNFYPLDLIFSLRFSPKEASAFCSTYLYVVKVQIKESFTFS